MNKICRMFTRCVSYPGLPKVLSLLLFVLSFPLYELQAQPRVNNEEEVVRESTYDQIPVEVLVAGFGNFNVDAIYTKNKILCINIEDLFRTLKIPCRISKDGNSITGYIENESRAYTIDLTASQIKTGNKIVYPKAGLLKELGSLYLESSLFSEAFGINLVFNYRSLSMILKSNFELPAMKLQRIDKMRGNMSKVRGEIKVDTIIHRNYHLLKFGTLDWSASSTQSWNFKTYNQVGIGIGTEFLFGEANLSVNLYDQQKFNFKQLNYLWRWIDNDKLIIKQALAGKLSTSSISFISAPVIGLSVRNSPTTVRKATGYYNINDLTEPNWAVELYINNVLVDYTTADATGLYIFKVPIVYGYTTLKLKFYGPLGEERTEERTMNVPYTVMSKNEFEYGLTGGMVQDSVLSRYGKADFNYGVNHFLTIGGGIEYLSSILVSPYIPFVRLTIQPFSKLIINAEYDHNVKVRGLLNYYITKDALLEIDYSNYVEGQHATSLNALEEWKVKFSFPMKLKKLNGYAKLDYSQMVFKTLNSNLANVIFSAYYGQLSANSSTQFNWTNQSSAYISSILSLSCRLKKGLVIRPSAEYIVNYHQLMSYEMAVEKYIPKGNFSLSYKRNFLSNYQTVSLSFKYDLRFAKTGFSSNYSNGQLYTSESAQGSFAFGSGQNTIRAGNNSSMSKGGISFYPFLDINQNGIFDKGEPMVKLNTLKIEGGNAVFSKMDSIVRVPDLNAFTNYLVEFNNNDLSNIALRFKKNIYKVLIDPNQFKRIDIPVVSVGEVSGTTNMNTNNSVKEIGRILVKIYRKDNAKEIAEILSESDGYIYYLGLSPGEYIARIDSQQLKMLNMVSSPSQIPVTISQSLAGDIVEGLNFTMSPVKEKISDSAHHVSRTELDTIILPLKNNRITEFKIKNKTYSIYNERTVMQVGAFKIKTNAFNTFTKLRKLTGKRTFIIYDQNLHIVRVSGFKNHREADNIAANLLKLKLPYFFLPLNTPRLSLQIGEFEKKEDALQVLKKWRKTFGKPAFLIFNENGSFNVVIQGLSGYNEIEFVINLENQQK